MKQSSQAGSSSTEQVAAGYMPAWEVAELPEPPKIRWGIRELIGPGLMMAGAAIGGGEWLMGPAVTAQYGGTIMWLATASILTQLVYNLEVMRYALYCGEPIFVGFFRLVPGPRFWTALYLFIDFFGLWPYLSANAAVPLSAAILGHLPGALPTQYLSTPAIVEKTGLAVEVVEEVRHHPERFAPKTGAKPLPAPLQEWIDRERQQTNWIGYAIFLTAFLPLIFGGKIYNALVKIMVVKIVLVLGYLLFIAFFYVRPAIWGEVFAGFVFLSQDASGAWGIRLFPAEASKALDWALLGAFAAIAGQGGLTNSQFSSYARDRGWGMGQLVGAIPSLVGGRDISLAHTGKVFLDSDESRRRWRGWQKVIWRDQWAIWFVGCILGMAIPSLISLEFVRGITLRGDEVAAATAQAIAARTNLEVFWFLTLLCGFLVLAPNQISTIDGLIRRWTDVLWTGSPRLQNLEGREVRYVYFGLLMSYAVWGIVILVWTGSQPLELVKISGAIMNFALGFSAFHTLAVNLILLPPAFRPSWISRLGLVACGAFFIAISLLGFQQTFVDWGWIRP